MLQTLLDYVARELVVAKLYNLTFDALNYSVFVFQILSLLEYVLNDVVAKLIFSKDGDICENEVNNRPCLRFLAVFKYPLDYSATIGM
jgi:hypothetical protein